MRFQAIARMLLASISAMSMAVSSATAGEPGTCPNDSKLLNGGPTQIFGEGPGTWWGLIVDGLLAAGFVEEDDQVEYLNQIFGTNFDALEEVKAYNLQLVKDGWDANGNGYVCAFQLRGTRAHFDNPYLNLTFFGISDDKVAKQ